MSRLAALTLKRSRISCAEGVHARRAAACRQYPRCVAEPGDDVVADA